MGLDMTVYATENADLISEMGFWYSSESLVDFLERYNAPEDLSFEAFNEVWYWRKHNALHAFFEDYAQTKYGVNPDDFNVSYLRITNELLDELESAIVNNMLTPRGGFFFGSTNYDPSVEVDSDLEFINRARIEMARGSALYYHPWW